MDKLEEVIYFRLYLPMSSSISRLTPLNLVVMLMLIIGILILTGTLIGIVLAILTSDARL